MKLADQKALQELALKQQKQEKNNELETTITDEELEDLYHIASQEINGLKMATTSYKNILKNCFYSEFIFDEALTNIFFETIEKLLIKLLPAILEGNYDIIFEELGGQITEESFNNLRIGIYNSLKEKYIRED